VHTNACATGERRGLRVRITDEIEGGVGEIVEEDIAEFGAVGGHGFGAELAEADAVALTCAVEVDLGAFGVRVERIAGDGVPAEAAVDGEAASFASGEEGGVFGGEFAGPTVRRGVAVVAENGEIGIGAYGQAGVCGSARAAAATAREHGGEPLGLVGEDQAARLAGGAGRGAGRRGRFAKDLAVSEVAELIVSVASFCGDEVRTRDDGLGLERFERRTGSGLGLNDGSDGSLEVCGDDGGELAISYRDSESSVVAAADLAGHGEKKIGWACAAGADEFAGAKFAAVNREADGIAIELESGRGVLGSGLQRETLTCQLDDKGAGGSGADFELCGMETAKDSDADCLCGAGLGGGEQKKEAGEGGALHGARAPDARACGQRCGRRLSRERHARGRAGEIVANRRAKARQRTRRRERDADGSRLRYRF